MSRKSSPVLVHFSQQLRKNMTAEERHLWYDFLKPLPVVFKRQSVIGKYIVDFYCPKYKLVIELDGSQHYEDENRQADSARDSFMHSQGLIVLRYSNADINQRFKYVCEDISSRLESLGSDGF